MTRLPREIWMMILEQKKKNFRDRLFRYVKKMFWCFDLLICKNFYFGKSVDDQIECLLCYWIDEDDVILHLKHDPSYLSMQCSKQNDYRNKNYGYSVIIGQIVKRVCRKDFCRELYMKENKKYRIYQYRVLNLNK